MSFKKDFEKPFEDLQKNPPRSSAPIAFRFKNEDLRFFISFVSGIFLYVLVSVLVFYDYKPRWYVKIPEDYNERLVLREERGKLLSEIPGEKIILASGPKNKGLVRIFSDEGVLEQEFYPFGENYNGGLSICSCDLDGDSQEELIFGALSQIGPKIKITDRYGRLKTGAGFEFTAFHPDNQRGVSVSCGDVDGDSVGELGVSQATLAQAFVKIYKIGSSGQKVISYFNVFGAPEIGADIGFGDVDKDGKDEFIVGAGPGGGPHVRVFDIDGGIIGEKPIDFFAFHEKNRGGVRVSSGDFDGDGRDDIGVCQSSGNIFGNRTNDEAWCKIYNFDNERSILFEKRVFPANSFVGADPAFLDINSDGREELLITTVAGSPQVLAFDQSGNIVLNFFGFDDIYTGIGTSIGSLKAKKIPSMTEQEKLKAPVRGD